MTCQAVSEIDELNRILLVERELVLKTQENYRCLKEKFIDLQRENEILIAENERWRQSNCDNQEHRESLAALEAKSEKVIREIKEANEEREVRNEKFKMNTLEELQNVFKKEILDQNVRIEKLQEDRNELVSENDELLERIAILKTENEDLKRRQKSKEAEIRLNFDEKLRNMIKENDDKISPRLEHYSKLIIDLQNEIRKKEEEKIEKNREISRILQEKNAKIENCRKTENELRIEIDELRIRIERFENEKSEQINLQKEHDIIVSKLNKKLEIQLKERIDLESKLHQTDRHWEKKMGNLEMKLLDQITECERLCEQRRSRIVELENEVGKVEELQRMLAESEKSRQIEEEHVDRMDTELKTLYARLESIEDEKQQFMSSLKYERDKLEQTIAFLKKELQSTPESAAEVKRLRKELRESENRRSNEKEKYQTALAEMKSALKSIEKQQRNTYQKLRQSLAAR